MVTALFISDKQKPSKSMDNSLLDKFRLQLASWLEERLGSHRLPFQRLEICPRTLTEQGRLTPDLVLWINRDSQLAGSMILLPVTVNERTLAEGQALARALGLGHFTTWAAREVAIWGLTTGAPEKLNSFFLPSANRIIPQDFQDTLDELLEQLKIVTVTQPPLSSDYPAHYFANLCLRNLQELSPGLTVSARLSGGQSAADDWVEQAPREKAWLSLWRILFLLWQGRLPPGLQPERLEDAIDYALGDLTEGTLTWLSPKKDEPPLPEEEAVRLYHLAGRLRQLGWPQDISSANELVELLLKEAAHRFAVETITLPWQSTKAELNVFTQTDTQGSGQTVIAPQAYLAGCALQEAWSEKTTKKAYAESLNTSGNINGWDSARAVFKSTQKLSRQESEANLILLRSVWPNRRFDLPRNTPAWLWDMLFVTGLTSNEISLTLPAGWHLAPGVDTLWDILKGRWQIAEICSSSSDSQSLRLLQCPSAENSCIVHREDYKLTIPVSLCRTQLPGTIQLWLKGQLEVIELVIDKMMFELDEHWQEEGKQLQQGALFFLTTTLGAYLWELCSNNAPMPGQEEALQQILAHGIPIPNEQVLSELAMTMALHGTDALDTSLVDQEFSGIFGNIPDIDTLNGKNPTSEVIKTKRRTRISSGQVAAKVFIDGVPLFPEHYLMEFYRPSLTSYELHGPLQIKGEFFDRISLKTIDKDHTIEVSGAMLAEALTLASYCCEGKVSLPDEEQILTEIIQKYRADLNKLWEELSRECRGVAPLKQSAVKLARKIWQEHGLPPQSI